MARKAKDNSKLVRYDAILKLIEEKNIGTQQDLVNELLALGFDVTQSTISRDIKDLALVKTTSRTGVTSYRQNKSKSGFRPNDKFKEMFHSTFVGMDSALNQVVIHCYTGMANAICAAMDGMDWNGVIGTIAGDDTILVICKTESAAKELITTLKSYLA